MANCCQDADCEKRRREDRKLRFKEAARLLAEAEVELRFAYEKAHGLIDGQHIASCIELLRKDRRWL